MSSFEVADQAAKGGTRARRLSQSAKNMEVIDNQKTTARKKENVPKAVHLSNALVYTGRKEVRMC
jgi:hypothetical protein